MRSHNRSADDLRPITFVQGFIGHHPGSVLTSFGKTRVLVTATYENRVPPHRLVEGGGWLSAEYGMIPGSTSDRKARPTNKNPDGRSIEIQRLIGRALRQAFRLNRIGQRTILIDCDVIEADGGTRTAAITGGFIALLLCLQDLVDRNQIRHWQLKDLVLRQVAAVSIGVVAEKFLVDPDYEEDKNADMDFNLVASGDGSIIEFQGATEGLPMQPTRAIEVLNRGLRATKILCERQAEVLAQRGIVLSC